ncbi:MAG: hypothetical protein WAV54_00460 [Acidimicrobiales bacterium]
MNTITETRNRTARRHPPNSSAGSAQESGEPEGQLTPVEWFVAEMAKELGLGQRPVDVRCRRILLRLSSWATSQGLPLEREAVLDPDTVERFCQLALANDRSRATFRSDLRRMGPLLTRLAPWQPRPAAMATRNVAPPYSCSEVELLRSDAASQPTWARLRGARALLALGLGAGLDGRWVARVEARSVTRRGNVVEVRVGEPAARLVVVRAEWEEEVIDLARTAGSDYLIGGRSEARNRVADLAKRLVRPADHPRLSPAGLRSTWLLWHLEVGTRLPELCRAAGLQGFEVLSDLLPLVSPLGRSDEVAQLRGGAR